MIFLGLFVIIFVENVYCHHLNISIIFDSSNSTLNVSGPWARQFNTRFNFRVDLTPGSGSPVAVLSFTPCYFCLGYTIKFDGTEIMLLREKKVIGSKTLDSPTLNTNMYFMTKYHRNGVLKLKVGIPKSGDHCRATDLQPLGIEYITFKGRGIETDSKVNITFLDGPGYFDPTENCYPITDCREDWRLKLTPDSLNIVSTKHYKKSNFDGDLWKLGADNKTIQYCPNGTLSNLYLGITEIQSPIIFKLFTLVDSTKALPWNVKTTADLNINMITNDMNEAITTSDITSISGAPLYLIPSYYSNPAENCFKFYRIVNNKPKL